MSRVSIVGAADLGAHQVRSRCVQAHLAAPMPLAEAQRHCASEARWWSAPAAKIGEAAAPESVLIPGAATRFGLVVAGIFGLGAVVGIVGHMLFVQGRE